jgi:hypothetical protein
MTRLPESPQRLGHPNELDDDRAHRFLAPDYVCHMIPDSSFVRYLVEASGAPSVVALRASLLAPATYSPDFRLFDSFHGRPLMARSGPP